MRAFRHIFLSGLLAMAIGAGSADALVPAQPCSGPEGGMVVDNAMMFDPVGGFVYEYYGNLDSPDGVVGGADGPIPALNDFHGFRITECRSGRILAVSRFDETFGKTMLATEFLRNKARNDQPFTMGDVKSAAKAIFGGQPAVRFLDLRETEETCACRDFFPGMWRQ